MPDEELGGGCRERTVVGNENIMRRTAHARRNGAREDYSLERRRGDKALSLARAPAVVDDESVGHPVGFNGEPVVRGMVSAHLQIPFRMGGGKSQYAGNRVLGRAVPHVQADDDS
ncbi:MAG: hypothetical protein IKC14_03140 [Kiritimatiellae bacterium]|nr:hypothetical protein [Kiritimatiellia bacterium]